ncbi:phage holin family protein [Flavobacterium sp.]|uniref:phage holin family protein n=1 Tax=Flavobacterium sp. TaxID=239 RepID=UPI0025CDD23A|nr:phage holin family protein [Flavobacterium sp.]
MQLNEKLEAITNSLKEYADTNYELIKLEVIDHSSDIISGLVSTLVVGVALLIFLLFGSLYAAYYLSDLLQMDYIGFAIVGGFYLLVALIFHFNKKKLIESRVCDNFIKRKMAKKS